MATLPIPPFPALPARELPDYLPARMVNEFVYCPRLFFYEWVEGLFQESADTVEGKLQHKRVDKSGKPLPSPERLAEETLETRAVTLSSDRLRVIAKMDLLEVENGCVTPVDYKHGKPYEVDGALQIWPADRAQLAVQAVVLRENGYRVEEGVIFYAATRQRVRVPLDRGVIGETEAAIRDAWALAEAGRIPAPLDESPKCPGCSLNSICLPGETTTLRNAAAEDTEQLALFEEMVVPRKPALPETRRLIAPRTDLRPVYLNTQGLKVGRSGEVLQVKDKDTLRQEIRPIEISQLNLMGNIQVTTQVTQLLCEAGIPVCYFSQGGWFYGITTGMTTKNVFLRQTQFRLAAEPWFCLKLARRLVAGKIRNQRTMLLRNHTEPPEPVLRAMKEIGLRADAAMSPEELLGIEGNAARLYFGAFDGMLKTGDQAETPEGFRLDFEGRNRRPPRDPVNALLSLGYSVLTKDLTIACYAVGFDPMMGYYHQPRFGRPALALDLMEPFRPLIVDSAVINAINTRMVTAADFMRSGDAVALTPAGRKGFYHAYELRMDTLVTHPIFECRVSYRRLLEVQARLLGRVLEGETGDYPVFVTR
ncbi:MAG: CRISPR-associated endonuclease Cas1 [Bryobacteraceae bacterium]